MKIRINAKSIPNLEQLLYKINAGFKNIEIQLLHKYVSNLEYLETKQAIEKYGIDISVVHSPLILPTETSPEFEIALHHLLISEIASVFEDTVKYANYIAKLENHRIKVVIHNDFSKQIWEQTNLINEKIGPLVQKILSKYEFVDLLIENAPSSNYVGFRTIFNMNDVSYAVKILNEFIPNRVNTLLDTCHTLINWELWKRYCYIDLTNWNEAFELSTANTPLGLIHLNNIRDNGMDSNHGIPFDYNLESDRNRLKSIMDAYQKYASCEITIEVREKNYCDVPYNLITTKECLEKMGYDLYIG